MAKFVSVKKTSKFKDKQGRDAIALTIDPENLNNFLAELDVYYNAKKGVQVIIHTEERESKFGGTFLSSFMVMDEIKEYKPGEVKKRPTFKEKENTNVAANARRLQNAIKE